MKAIAIEHDKTKSFFNDRYVWLLLIISLSVRIYLSFFTYVIRMIVLHLCKMQSTLPVVTFQVD